MKWYDPIFLGDSLKDKPAKARHLKWRISHHGGCLNAYLITLASNPENLLDMIPAGEILQKGYPRKGMLVIGLAADYSEALELVRQIIEETYNTRQDTDVRSFLMERKDRQK